MAYYKMGNIKKLFNRLYNSYGIKFDLDEQPIYEILQDMTNIESYFNQIREKLKNYKER